MITSLNSYIAAAKSRVTLQKTASRTSVANIPFSVFDQAGQPGAGTLAVGNTANGVVPTDALAGYPLLPAPPTDLQLTKVLMRSSVACWIDLYDCLFSAGAYAFNADVTLASQPSFAARVPGSDYNNLELWIEAVTAFMADCGAVLVPELNYQGQFAQLVQAETCRPVHRYNRVTGTPLRVEDIYAEVRRLALAATRKAA